MTLLRLQYIDQAVANTDHPYLKPQHKCYFLREYTSGQNYNFGETNQLIINLKKAMSRQGRPEWRYKEKAIHQIAEELSAVVPDDYFERTAFVPVPPSKARSDPEYDPRLIEILELEPGRMLSSPVFLLLVESFLRQQGTLQTSILPSCSADRWRLSVVFLQKALPRRCLTSLLSRRSALSPHRPLRT